MKFLIVLLISLSLWAAPKRLEAGSHIDKGIPVTFDICLAYSVCSFKFTEDRVTAQRMGFFHDMVVLRMKDLGNMTYIEECNSGISDFRSYIWQLAMQRIAQADSLVLIGEKHRSMLQGTVLIDEKSAKDLILELISEYNECKF
ncbi:MAG: hypothetical protein VW729_17795 [Deltaproteobacteria bacterium]